MNINRIKHNLFFTNTVHPGPIYTDTTGEKKVVSGTVYVGGGSGLSTEDRKKLDSVEFGALKNQDAFSYFKVSDGINEATQAARIPMDLANLSIVGDETVLVWLETDYRIDLDQFTSTIVSETPGTYTVSYKKVATPDGTPAEGEELQYVYNYPLDITWVSGSLIMVADLTRVDLMNGDTVSESYTVGNIMTATSNESGYTSFHVDKSGLYFDSIRFIKTVLPEVGAEDQTTKDEIICLLDAVVRLNSTIRISTSGEGGGSTDPDKKIAYWYYDPENPDTIYTDYNAYSKKELSAWGNGDSGTGGASGFPYLRELLDVDILSPSTGDILLYNGSEWVNVVFKSYLEEIAFEQEATSVGYVLTGALIKDKILTFTTGLRVDLTSEQLITGLKIFDDRIRIGNAVIRWDSERSSLAIENAYSGNLANIYATGEVTAYGVNDTVNTFVEDYVKKEGDIMTGSLTAPAFIKSDSSDDYVLLAGGGVKALDTIVSSGGALGKTLTFTGGFTGSYNGSTDITISVPTSFPASDVYSWAKSYSKPSYSASEISGLATVATTGNYNNLSNKPTIPSVYNSTITINYNGSNVGSFNLNQSSSETVYITGGGVSSVSSGTNMGSISVDGTNVYVKGLSDTSGDLKVSTDLLVTGGITMHYSSDRTLKRNILEITGAGKLLLSIGKVYSFEYIDSEVEISNSYRGKHIGLIYQEVKDSVLNSMTYKRDDGKGTINYIDTNFISLIAATCMEHENKIDQLNDEISLLKNKIIELESKDDSKFRK